MASLQSSRRKTGKKGSPLVTLSITDSAVAWLTNDTYHHASRSPLGRMPLASSAAGIA